MVKRNFKLTLAYDGADFFGWQVQPERSTVQGELQAAIERVTGERPLPQGSGRTDAGVHALAQVASFELESSIPVGGLHIALNRTLPAAIRVLAVEQAAPAFHARKSAKAKSYRYRIFRQEICPPFLARYVHHHPFPLNEEAITFAADVVTGEHDFTSFAASDPEKGTEDEPPNNVREIFSSNWRRNGDEFVYEVRGSGFLHHMVRNLVGTFLLIGKGTLTRDDLKRILDARDRSLAGATAPAGGLYLVSVEY